jgi:hypothetical protein
MRVEPWVNEGFACVVAALASKRIDLLDRALERAADAPVRDLNTALDDLFDANRSEAFAVATGSRVARRPSAGAKGRVWLADSTRKVERLKMELLCTCGHVNYDGTDYIPHQTHVISDQ